MHPTTAARNADLSLPHALDMLNNIPMLFSLAVPLGSTPALPAESCKEIKASEGQAVSGKHWLSSIKTNIPVLAHCDMETEGEFSYLR